MKNYLFINIVIDFNQNNNNPVVELQYIATDHDYKIFKSDTIPFGEWGATGFMGLENLKPLGISNHEGSTNTNETFISIKKLLEDKNSIIFGFNVEQYIDALINLIDKYNLPGLNIKYYDLMEIIEKMYPRCRHSSANEIYRVFGGNSFNNKGCNSCEDLIEILKNLEKESGLSAEELVKKFDNDGIVPQRDKSIHNHASYSSFSYGMPHPSDYSSREEIERFLEECCVNPHRLKQYKKQLDEQPDEYGTYYLDSDFEDSEDDDENYKDNNYSQKVALDSSIILNNSLTEDVLGTIDRLGYTSVDLVGQCDILLCLDHKSKKEFIEEYRKNKHHILVLTLCEFMSSLP